ncbi:MAG: hypothetical protein HYR49_00300 [Gammaproteobacteria bacterium]|nr:hypothetical protein [Gammaproteobacteria bacterium]
MRIFILAGALAFASAPAFQELPSDADMEALQKQIEAEDAAQQEAARKRAAEEAKCKAETEAEAKRKVEEEARLAAEEQKRREEECELPRSPVSSCTYLAGVSRWGALRAIRNVRTVRDRRTR